MSTSEHTSFDEYRADVLDYMEVLQFQAILDPRHLDDIWEERSLLLSKLIEQHQHFDLLPGTLFSTVNLVDRCFCVTGYLCNQDYQLLGCAALLIAAKYNDDRGSAPSPAELVEKWFHGERMVQDLIEMERLALHMLDWEIGRPNINEFLELKWPGEDPSLELKSMTLYVSELMLYHREFISVRPSLAAMSSLAMAQVALCVPISICDNETREVMFRTLGRLYNPPKALLLKYSQPRFHSVSTKIQTILKRVREQFSKL